MPASKPAAPADGKIRAFVALPLPEEIKGALGLVIEALAPGWPRGEVRWVRPENMHLTLRFLGDTPTEKLEDIAAALAQLGARTKPFALGLEGLGSFPNRRRPRVVWVGLRDEADALAPLKEAVDRALAPLGWPLEQRPFRPHLTLGRVKGRQVVKGDWSATVPQLSFNAGPLELVESQLQRSGPVYIVRCQKVLSGG